MRPFGQKTLSHFLGKMKNYELIEHTGDIALRVHGKTIKELFINSAAGLLYVITDKQAHSTGKKRKIRLNGEILEDLLVSWLNEIIFLFYTYHFLPKCYNIKIQDNGAKTIESVLAGGYLAENALGIKTEVKAATYHNVKIERNNAGLTVTIILDV